MLVNHLISLPIPCFFRDGTVWAVNTKPGSSRKQSLCTNITNHLTTFNKSTMQKWKMLIQMFSARKSSLNHHWICWNFNHILQNVLDGKAQNPFALNTSQDIMDSKTPLFKDILQNFKKPTLENWNLTSCYTKLDDFIFTCIVSCIRLQKFNSYYCGWWLIPQNWFG